ncbi:MAG: 16S rRNA (guanine(966)-N(2))-methyltransferase RsmD [Legionellales bacterium]|nr:16S rRNA (guanine(966)-N(2))-methyltransferase RsmD [Legionellales bacterium]|tara:strand:+ start:1018 stop:1584 length:567 start_codon:yes stop_codon:yes gene_type:complete
MSQHSIRIIGGCWRRRAITVPPNTSVRPTMGSLKETIFSWLQYDIRNARCLDLFAGSGSLGLEALSRGAGLSVFIDQDPRMIQSIGEHLLKFNADPASYEIHCGVVPDCLKHLSHDPFDIVFLDPPYSMQHTQTLLNALVELHYIAAGSCVIVEEASTTFENFPKSFKIINKRRLSQAQCHVLRYDPL